MSPEQPERRAPHAPVSNKKQEVAERTMAAMLEAGAALFAESLRNDPTQKGGLLSAVRATDVVASIDLTTGAFFHWWKNQGEYRDDLLQYLLAKLVKSANLLSAKAAETWPSPEAGAELLDSTGHISSTMLNVMGDDFNLLLLLTALHGSDERIEERIKEIYRSIEKNLGPPFKRDLETCNLQFKPPFTVEHYLTAIGSLANGFRLHEAVDPSLASSNELPPLLGALAHAMALQMTEPTRPA